MPREHHDETGRPEGWKTADAYSDGIVETCGEAGLGDMIDWSRFERPEDEEGEILPRERGRAGGRGAGGAGGSSAINAFPGVPTGDTHPVFHLLLPVAPSPGSRPAEALSRRAIYYAAAMRSVGRWAMHHRGESKPLELHVLSDCFPLMPQMSAVGVQSLAPTWLPDDPELWDDPMLWHMLRRHRHRMGTWLFGGRAGDAHAAIGAIARHLPTLTLRVKLVVGPKRAIDLPPYTGRTWPKGW